MTNDCIHTEAADVTSEHQARSLTHRVGHWPKFEPGCDTCDSLYSARQADIFAAARVIRDSERLRWEEIGNVTTGFYRAAIAMAYVQNVHHTYATGEDFDERFEGVHDTFRDFADELAQEAGPLADAPADSQLSRYFDYELWARDLQLGGDYYAMELPGFYQVAVFHGG